MNDLVNIITNNGIGVACVLYLMYFQLTAAKETTQAMQELTKTLEGVNVRLTLIEDKLNITNENK